MTLGDRRTNGIYASDSSSSVFRRRSAAAAAKAIVIALALLAAGCATCRMNVFLLPGKRAINELKNRTALPTAAEFEARVTLAAMLAPGEDRGRWEDTRAAAIDGYIVRTGGRPPGKFIRSRPSRCWIHSRNVPGSCRGRPPVIAPRS